jgi:hypothetical protein
MEDPDTLRKRRRFVLLGAIFGAVFVDALMLATGLLYELVYKAKPASFAKDFLVSLDMLLLMPAVMLSPVGGAITNAYVVNAVLGALTFGAIAAVWQFIIKAKYEN